MRKLLVFWVLWALTWILAIKVLIAFELTPYMSVGSLIAEAIVDIFAAWIFARHPLLRYFGFAIFTMALIFSFNLVFLVCYILSMILLYVTYRAFN